MPGAARAPAAAIRLISAVAAAGLAAASALPVRAQADAASALPAVRGFEIEPAAAAVLHTLWESSQAARAERVACIGGDFRNGVAVVTRVLLLEPTRSDSLAVAASASIERCGPPDWFGTAHTHIARYDGQHPYATFSGSDRGVMLLWWRRWGTEGVFCLLYGTREAHCETDGASGGLVARPETNTTY